MKRLRHRLAWLLVRRYVTPIIEEYVRLSHPAKNPAGANAARNCSYIAIGLRYAYEGRETLREP